MLFTCCRPIKPLKLIQTSLLNYRFLATLPKLKIRCLNSKLSDFMKSGLLKEAENLFGKMPERTTVSWNTMIRGYFQNGLPEKAVYMYDQMRVRDMFSYNTMISGLMLCGDVRGAEEVFELMEIKDVVTWNSMISGYLDNDLVDDAVSIFNTMPSKDVVSWNLVISGILKVKKVDFAIALSLFRQMPLHDVASWTIMIKGFLSDGRVAEAREFFDCMPLKDVQAWNTMILGYIEQRYPEIAEALFHKMPNKDCTSWNIMINGLVNDRRMSDAMCLFREMHQKDNQSWKLILSGLIMRGLVREAHAFVEIYRYRDTVLLTKMIVGYMEIGEVNYALKVFDLIFERDTTVWNATIFGLGENDLTEEGIKLFIRMKEETLNLDEATFTSILVLCWTMPSLTLGKQVHALVVKEGMEVFISVSNAVINMYFRCGSIDFALQEFSFMLIHDIISWNSIICGLAHHGYGAKAIAMFEDMRLTDVHPNQVTFIGVLSACSHADLVEEGKCYFDDMKIKYSLVPTTEHYTCIVDLLGRRGQIDEALRILDRMGLDGLDVPGSVWGALLGACRIHKNYNVGEISGEKVLELEPSNSGVYIILAEMFLACGRREAAEKMLMRMKEKRVKKQPGCSWIELNNSSNVFLAGDRMHPHFNEASVILDLIYDETGTKFFTDSDKCVGE